jgi:DUF4097 and DUF4098 domain-containing protein YvlB
MKQHATVFFLALAITGTTILHAATEEQKKKDKSFDVDKGGTLEVSIEGGDVNITTWDKNEVSINITGLDDDDYSNLEMVRQGNVVRVTTHDSWSQGGRFNFNVPTEFNLDIETSAGDIITKGRLKGDVRGTTSAGDITFDDIEGTVKAQTSGGDIRTGRMSGKAVLNTSGGEIEVASSTSDLELQTSGGDIRVGNVGKSLRASTAGGDITIGDVGSEAKVSTAGGNVKVGKVTGQATLSTAGGDVELSGGNGVIRASTSGGNIRLAYISGSVRASTSGGDIHAELTPSGKGESQLTSSNGKIALYVPETAKATITARIRIHGRWRSQKDEYNIRSDFKEDSSLRDEDEREIRSEYILNGGGESIKLETVNSDIEIRKLKK